MHDIPHNRPNKGGAPGHSGAKNRVPSREARPCTLRHQTELYSFELPFDYEKLYGSVRRNTGSHSAYPITAEEFGQVFSFFDERLGKRITTNTVMPIFQHDMRLAGTLASRKFTGLRPYSPDQTKIEVVVHSYPADGRDHYIANPRPDGRFFIELTRRELDLPYEQRVFSITFTYSSQLELNVEGPMGQNRKYILCDGGGVTERQTALDRLRAMGRGRSFRQTMLDPTPHHTYVMIDRSQNMGSHEGVFRTYPQTHGDPGPNGITMFACVTEWVADYISARREVSSDLSQERLTLASFTGSAARPLIRWAYVDAPLPTADELLSLYLDTDHESCGQDMDMTIFELARKSQKTEQPELVHCALFATGGWDGLRRPEKIARRVRRADFDYFGVVGFMNCKRLIIEEIAQACNAEQLYPPYAYGLRTLFGFGPA